MVAKVQQVESGIMAHFLFCISMGGSQRYSVEFCFLYTLCIIVFATQAKFYKVCQVEFHTRFGGRERQQSKFTFPLFTQFPPFTKQQKRLICNKHFQWNKTQVCQADESNINNDYFCHVSQQELQAVRISPNAHNIIESMLSCPLLTETLRMTNFPAPLSYHLTAHL